MICHVYIRCSIDEVVVGLVTRDYYVLTTVCKVVVMCYVIHNIPHPTLLN